MTFQPIKGLSLLVAITTMQDKKEGIDWLSR